MMITMHACLRDRFNSKALILESFLLIISVFLNAFVFIDYKYSERLHLSKENMIVAIGIMALTVFSLSLILMLVKWREKAVQHNQAVRELSRLLLEVRASFNNILPEERPVILKEFNNKYDQILGMLIPVPEKSFNRLKSKHLRKIEFSKFITMHPSNPYFLLRIKFFFKSLSEN